MVLAHVFVASINGVEIDGVTTTCREPLKTTEMDVYNHGSNNSNNEGVQYRRW